MTVTRILPAGLGLAILLSGVTGCASEQTGSSGPESTTTSATAASESASSASPETTPQTTASTPTSSPSSSKQATRKPSSQLQAAADEVLVGLRDNDYQRLSKLAAAQGVRFSPWAYIDVEGDVTLTPAQIAKLGQDRKKYLWGVEAGSGDVIETTWAKYNDRFGFSHDFLAADEVTENGIVDAGSTTNNIEQAYPGAKYVDYHIAGVDPQFEGLDWASVRVVLVKDGGEYRWVGLVHDQWTP